MKNNISRTDKKRNRVKTELNLRPIAFAIATVFSGILPNICNAATYTVTSNADSGPGSLREAIGFANATPGINDTIEVSQFIFLESPLSITDSLTITSQTRGILSADPVNNPTNRIIDASSFTANSGHSITLENLSISDAEGGGGVFVKYADLTINNCQLSNNSSTSSGGAIYAYYGNVVINNTTITGNSTSGSNSKGGGVYIRYGETTITQSTIANNSTSGTNAHGGGLAVFNNENQANPNATIVNSTISNNSTTGNNAKGGGIHSNYHITLTQSTISGNSTIGSTAQGGGIYNYSGDTTINQSTIFNNTSAAGAAGLSVITYVNGNTSRPVNITNSILSGNTNTGSATEGNFHNRWNSQASNVTAKYSFFGDALSEITGPTSTGNIINNNPDLRDLTSIGGRTFTHLPNIGSPVLDKGDNLAVPAVVDQRGISFDRIKFSAVDIGSVELQTTTPSIIINTNDSGAGSLRQSVLYANESSGLDTIEFTGIPLNSTITLDSELGIFDSLIIKGTTYGNAESVILDGNGVTRHFRISGDNDLTLENMTLTNGMSGESSGGGGSINNSRGDLVLNHTHVTNNVSSNVGGGIAHGRGTGVFGSVTLNHSKVSGNSTTTSGFSNSMGGGLYVDGDLILNHSTVSNNSTVANLGQGGGVYVGDGDLTLNHSTVSNNSTTGLLAKGGGISLSELADSITLNQSTISGNSTSGNFANGGGLHVRNIDAVINQSTIVNNSSVADGSGLHWVNRPAENNLIAEYTLNLTNSILSDNNQTNGTVDNFYLNSYVFYGNALVTNINASNSIFGDPEVEITGTNTANIFTNKPGLGPLQNNGGPTLSRLPNAASPALDSGSNVLATAFTTDQRDIGFTRIINNVVDIGATESVILPNKGKAITRAEIVKPILQAALIDPLTPNNPYTDVANNSFNADWIESFKAEGFTEGCDTNKFCPNGVVTKEQLAKMIIKAKDIDISTNTYQGTFSDVPASHPNALEIEALSIEGFTMGCATGRYCPQEAVTHEIFNNIFNAAFR